MDSQGNASDNSNIMTKCSGDTLLEGAFESGGTHVSRSLHLQQSMLPADNGFDQSGTQSVQKQDWHGDHEHVVHAASKPERHGLRSSNWTPGEWPMQHYQGAIPENYDEVNSDIAPDRAQCRAKVSLDEEVDWDSWVDFTVTESNESILNHVGTGTGLDPGSERAHLPGSSLLNDPAFPEAADDQQLLPVPPSRAPEGDPPQPVGSRSNGFTNQSGATISVLMPLPGGKFPQPIETAHMEQSPSFARELRLRVHGQSQSHKPSGASVNSRLVHPGSFPISRERRTTETGTESVWSVSRSSGLPRQLEGISLNSGSATSPPLTRLPSFKRNSADTSNLARPQQIASDNRHANGNEIDERNICDICRKPFMNNKKLNQHKRYHKPGQHVCDECHRPFVLKKDLMRHKWEKHTKIKQVCKWCGKSVKRSSNMKRHLTESCSSVNSQKG